MDIATKQRRFLVDFDLCRIVESTEGEVLAAQAKLEILADVQLNGLLEADTFHHLVQAKKLTASTVFYRDKLAFVIIHGFNSAGYLVVEGLASLGRQPLHIAFEATEIIRKHYHCKAVIFITLLKGLYEYAIKQGYKPMGVTMIKQLEQSNV